MLLSGVVFFMHIKYCLFSHFPRKYTRIFADFFLFIVPMLVFFTSGIDHSVTEAKGYFL